MSGTSASPPVLAAGLAETAAGKLSSRYQHSTKGASAQPRHGRVTGDVWAKTARASIHLLRTPRGWAVDLGDLDAAERCGVRLVCIRDLEQLTESWAAIPTIRARGFDLDRNFGKQRALPLDHWRPTREEAEALAETLREPEPVVRQLTMAGV